MAAAGTLTDLSRSGIGRATTIHSSELPERRTVSGWVDARLCPPDWRSCRLQAARGPELIESCEQK